MTGFAAPTAERLAMLRARRNKPNGTEASEQAFAISGQEMHDHLADALPGFRFGASVAPFTEILREAPYVEHVSLDLVGVGSRRRARATMPTGGSF